MITRKYFNSLFVTLVLYLCLGLLHAQTLTRGPYLQQLSQNGVIIRWRTDVATQSFVSFSKKDSSKIFVVKDINPVTEHIVELTNLQANTSYFYSVGTEIKTLASGKDFSFITAPSLTDNRPINIWSMGDFGDNSKPIYIQNQNAVRDQYLKNKANYTDLWLWLGDNAYCCGTDIEYQKQIFDFYGSNILANTAFFPVPGNHEYYETATGQVDKQINYYNVISVPTKAEMGGVASNTKEYYSYNYGNIHFIALDSYGLDEGKYRLFNSQSKQYQWLVNDLVANNSLWTIIYFHHPPYTKRSHDSNAEDDLRLMRENLVPIFDKYKVDLVMSGHSHVYERSYLMKGHTGHSETFNIVNHVVQNVNGKYEKNIGSSPIINKSEGTIYAVIGSAGRLDWNGDPNPHPSSVYSNVTIGGSLLMTIDNNRLDARWVCADGVIRDNFTVFKNVNKTEKQTIEFGEKVRLTSSWKGNHIWSSNVRNQDFIELSPSKDTLISVVDSLGFLKDNFQITVLPQPIITADIKDITSICPKKDLKVYFEVKNTTPEKWTYQLELSDFEGKFLKPLVLNKSNSSPITISLPDTLKESKSYRFRVVPNSGLFEIIPSNFFALNLPATASFVGNLSIPFDTITPLKLKFTGTPPYKFKIDNLSENTTNDTEITINVKQKTATLYSIENISNACGIGKVVGENKVIILAPLALEEENSSIRVFPNPTFDEVTIENRTGQVIKALIEIRDLNGKKLLNKVLIINEKENISLQELPSGAYNMTLKTDKFKLNKKIVKL